MKFKLASSMFASASLSGTSLNTYQATVKPLTKTNAYNCAYGQNATSIQNSLGHPNLVPHVLKKYFPIAKIPLPYGGYKQIFNING